MHLIRDAACVTLARMRKSNHSGAVSRKLIIWICIPVVVVGLVFVSWYVTIHRLNRERAAWKTATLEQLAAVSFTNENIIQELDKLKTSRASGKRLEWTAAHVLLMTNNEFLVYAFRHGFNDGFVDHLFLARSSDGRWYYSTYHFCNGMAAVTGEDPPASIAEFASKYAVREFDGKSDACLLHTWPEK